MSISEIKELRYKHGGTQEDLAAKLAGNVSSVQKWEQGLRHPGPKARKKMEAWK